MIEKSDIILVLIHGTNAKEAKWPRDYNEPLRKILCEELSDFNVKYDRKCWSGVNSHRERIKAGRELAKYLIQKYKENTSPLYLVGHSHGGSAISYALFEIGEKIKSLSGVINLATPHIHVEPKEYKTDFENLAISSSIISVLVFIPLTLLIMKIFQGYDLTDQSIKLTDIQATIFLFIIVMVACLSYFLIRFKLRDRMKQRFDEDDTATSLSMIHKFRRSQIPVLDVRVESDKIVSWLLHSVTSIRQWCEFVWRIFGDKWKKLISYLIVFVGMPFAMALSLLDKVPWIGEKLDAGFEHLSMAIGVLALSAAIILLVSYIFIIIPIFFLNRRAFGAQTPYINRFLNIYTEDFPQWCKIKDKEAGKAHTGKVIPWEDIEKEVKDILDKQKGLISKISRRHSAVYQSPEIIKYIASWIKQQRN